MKYDNIKPPCVDSPTDQRSMSTSRPSTSPLTLCCGIDGRYHFRLPFRKGEWIYASNGVILARVPAWCTVGDRADPHAGPERSGVGTKALYVETRRRGRSSPTQGREMLGVLGRCPQKDFPCSVHETADHELGNLMPCPSCGMLAVHEANDAVVLGRWCSTRRRCVGWRRSARRDVRPVKDDGKRPWRFVVDDLYMDGLVLPIATEAEYFKKDNA